MICVTEMIKEDRSLIFDTERLKLKFIRDQLKFCENEQEVKLTKKEWADRRVRLTYIYTLEDFQKICHNCDSPIEGYIGIDQWNYCPYCGEEITHYNYRANSYDELLEKIYKDREFWEYEFVEDEILSKIKCNIYAETYDIDDMLRDSCEFFFPSLFMDSY